MAMRRDMQIKSTANVRGRGIVDGYTSPSGWCDPMNERGKRGGVRGGSRQERKQHGGPSGVPMFFEGYWKGFAGLRTYSYKESKSN